MLETPSPLIVVGPSMAVSSSGVSGRVAVCDKRSSNDRPVTTGRVVKTKVEVDTNDRSKSDDNLVDRGCASLSVRFCRTVAIRQTLHHRNYTPQEMKACWYQSYEIREIRTTCIVQIQKSVYQGYYYGGYCDDDDEDTDDDTDDEESICWRGLESYKPEAQERKRRLRRETADAVFDVEDSGDDSITIAKMYSALTWNPQLLANLVGLRDQFEAKLCYTTTTTTAASSGNQKATKKQQQMLISRCRLIQRNHVDPTKRPNDEAPNSVPK
eukprot:CAMPEP_0172368082 /NCGR_PEP_ID=MMETSP1060-20121228/24992_1 /TAXON_ID=37318 /ORGANISM="Pseudo-nitzschia pungens, Strain cf. cingulata" /LENGTH=268 /DNA_ID=CAMNT_0013092541 /DNA_START=177 /DNA_END=983 /DNA_ORIENTATION=-